MISRVLLLVFIAVVHAAVTLPSCPYTQSNVMQSNNSTFLTSNGGTIGLPSFTLFNNVWGVLQGYATYSETIFKCSNGAGYGWAWNRGVSTRKWFPNYPETAYGLSPMYVGGPTTTPNLPVKLSNISSLVATMNISHAVSFDNNGANMWDFSYDIWWASLNPAKTDASKNITNEIMIWFLWNTGNVVTPVQANAVNDNFGNTYDYAESYLTSATTRYHQFRIRGAQRIPPKVDLKPFFDYIQNRFDNPDDWLCSLELGTENWDNTIGAAIVHNLSYQFSFIAATPKPTPKPTPSPAPTSKPTVSIAQSVTFPETVQPGGSGTIAFTVNSYSATFSGIVQVCFNPKNDSSNSQRLLEKVVRYNVTTGTNVFSWPISIPSTAAAGPYKATIGVYTSTWGGLAWKDPAVLTYICVPSTEILANSATPTTVARGSSTVAKYTVRSACPASKVNVMASLNPFSGSDSQNIAQNQTSVALIAGDTVISFTLKIPSTAATGSYRITMGVWADVTWTNLAYLYTGALITVV